MRILITIIIIIAIIKVILPSANAADSTPSATVKEKLELLKLEIASKAAKLKQEINRKLQNRAYIGIVKGKSPSSLTLATKSGTKIINITEDTSFQNTSKAKIKLSLATLKEEDHIAALGDVDDQGVLTARKIVLLPEVEKDQTQKTILWGQIVSTDELITIKDKSSQNVSLALGKSAEIKKSTLVNGDLIIATGIKNKQGIIEVGFIFIATPSANLR